MIKKILFLIELLEGSMLTVDGEPVYLTTTTSTVEVQEEVHVVTSNDETISRYENSETASELENKSKSLV